MHTTASRRNNGRRRSMLHCKRIGETTKEAEEIGKTVALEATSKRREPSKERERAEKLGQGEEAD